MKSKMLHSSQLNARQNKNVWSWRPKQMCLWSHGWVS